MCDLNLCWAIYLRKSCSVLIVWQRLRKLINWIEGRKKKPSDEPNVWNSKQLTELYIRILIVTLHFSKRRNVNGGASTVSWKHRQKCIVTVHPFNYIWWWVSSSRKGFQPAIFIRTIPFILLICAHIMDDLKSECGH